MNVPKSIKVGLAIFEHNQTWLAGKMGVSKAYVSKMCKGETNISLSRIEQLAFIFNVKVSELIKWGE